MGPSCYLTLRKIALTMAIAGWLVASIGIGGEISSRRRALQREFDAKLNGLVRSSTDAAERAWLSTWRIHGDPSRHYLFLPELVELPKSVASESIEEPASLRSLRKHHAQQTFDLAAHAIDTGDSTLAVQLLYETICFDGEHSEARKQLGLTETRENPRKHSVRRGRRPEQRLQWPAGGYLEVTSPHFRIVSNDSESTTRRLAMQLEALYGVWHQLFFEQSQRSRPTDDRLLTRHRKRGRHQVILFGTREAYVSHVLQLDRRARMTRGYYHAATKTAYFSGGTDAESSTWLHEVTHQLCHELLPTSRNAGIHRDAWAIEGVALYMESLQPCRRWWTVGGIEADRLQFARFRALRENFRVPLQHLTEMGRDQLQSHQRIGAVYSQCAGLTHYFMDGNHGQNRRKFLSYLNNVYATPRSKRSLSREVDMTFAEIEDGYLKFLQVKDKNLQRIDPNAHLVNLCITGDEVSDVGLRSLPEFDDARWIDLFATRITDEGTMGLSRARRLQQLNLEGTSVTDETVARLAKSPELTILDLSGTHVTDQSLALIGSLSKLQSLWLTGTTVTDAGIQELADLDSLQHLDLSGTHVSASGRMRLRRALPQLKIEPHD